MADKMSEHICPLGPQMKGQNLCQMQCQNTDSRWEHYVRENARKNTEIRQIECRKICQIVRRNICQNIYNIFQIICQNICPIRC